MDRRRVAKLVLAAAAVATVLVLGRSWPKDQQVRFVLGDAAPRVQELTVRYAPGGTDELARGASFRYGPDKPAPRIVTHEPRLADGDWMLEIEVASRTDRATVKRRVALEGKAVSIELAQAVPP